MKKLFEVLSKPAKMILIIGSFVYAAWFATSKAGSMGGNFMSVMTNLILMVVGTALLAATPVFLLIKKEELAKIIFFILAGYWLLSTFQTLFAIAASYAGYGSDGLEITIGIFAFITGLALVGILVLIVLEFFLKKPIFRFISTLVFAGAILFGFVFGLLFFIYYCKWDLGWVGAVNTFIGYMLLPALLFFGLLYFLGAPAVPEKAAPAKAEEKPAEPAEQPAE